MVEPDLVKQVEQPRRVNRAQPPRFRRLAKRFAQIERQFVTQFFQRVAPVAELTAFGAVGGLYSGRNMDDPDGAGSFVSLLSALAGGFEKIETALRQKSVVVTGQQIVAFHI